MATRSKIIALLWSLLLIGQSVYAGKIHQAAAHGDIQRVESILTRDSSQIEATDRRGNTPLVIAARYGKTKVAELLIKKGASVNTQDANGITPLHNAVFSGNKKLTAILLENGARMDIKDGGGRTPLYWGIVGGDVSLFDLLLTKVNDINQKDKEFGRTFLHMAAIAGQKDIIDRLVEKGAKIDTEDGGGKTALQLAALCDQGEVVEQLKALGAKAPVKPALKVTFVSNEGFLIETRGTKILIDSLFGPVNPGMPPDKTCKEIEAGHEPFDQIQVALVTHAHEDHFGFAPAGRFLEKNKKAILVAPQDVYNSMALYYARHAAIQDRIVACTTAWGETAALTVQGIRIKALALRHADEINFEYPHAAYLIELAGWKILHVGDALGTLKNFGDFSWIKEENIDIAFVPEWYLRVPEGKDVIAQSIKARHIVFMHISPGAESRFEYETRRGRSIFPSTTVFRKPMESKVFDS